ncbi:hypothetical protein SPBR_06816 [Sporothrix brasiliensis 5110]|uniref:Uncharacterized protein n=1 Tax=Sporothrix brasiliensis 5110 TaxID=1398154 RepID=A0A0C2EPP8_9PEZI|nr:uncharacterized protein SPBR_06816 [Sporothrix brasiliensis 5110]KIH88229.1 hypothetical protein SPBR_06816 [Sporothrix brasiliensis 5110]
MPSSLDAPVLQVDANVIHKVDTSNPQNLFSMWTDNVAQGRRLENLSWRLWTRETFCVEAAARITSSSSSDSFAVASSDESASIAPTSPRRPTTIPRRSNPSTEEVPQLSGSVESLADEDAVEFSSESSAVDIARPRIRRQDSCGSSRSRGRERHITSDDLEKMVVSIVQETEPLKGPLRDVSSSMQFSSPSPSMSPVATEQPEQTHVAPVSESQSALPEPTPEAEESAVAAPSAEPFPALAPEPVEEEQQQQEQEEVATPSTPPLQKSKSTTEVIRGFSPSHIPVVVPQILTPPPSDEQVAASADEDVIPYPTSEPAAKQVQSKKAATFALGGSSSCEDSMSDPSRSLEMRKSAMSEMLKRKSTPTPDEEGSLKSALHLSRHSLSQKKQTSFSSQLVTRAIPAPAVVSDDDDSESDDIDESAIDDDDDDSSDWEDSNEESGRSSMDDKTLFQRVDSTVHLPSRRSLITLMIQRSEREVKNGLTTSQSTLGLNRARPQHSLQVQLHQQQQQQQQQRQRQHQPPSLVASPNDSDDAALMMRHRPRGPQSTLRPINEIPRSAAQPIMTSATAANHAPALSPRTNRRNMLSTELTESLRRHLLWERSQKTSTANAVLKRRHTSQDVANLRQYPEPVHMGRDDAGGDANANSFDQYLNRDAYNGYHAKGW